MFITLSSAVMRPSLFKILTGVTFSFSFVFMFTFYITSFFHLRVLLQLFHVSMFDFGERAVIAQW